MITLGTLAGIISGMMGTVTKLVVVTGGGVFALDTTQRGIKYYKKAKHPIHYQLYKILIDKEFTANWKAFQNYYESLYQLKLPLVFELHANRHNKQFYVYLPILLENSYPKILNAVDPIAELKKIENNDKNYTALTLPTAGKPLAGASLRLAKPSFFPLETSQTSDPIVNILSSLSNLKMDENLVLQLYLTPAEETVKEQMSRDFKEYSKNASVPLFPLRGKGPYLSGIINDMSEIPLRYLSGIKNAVMEWSVPNSLKGHKDRPLGYMDIRQKTEATVFFDSSIRILSTAPTEFRAKSNLQAVLAALSITAHKNYWHAQWIKPKKLDAFAQKVRTRSFGLYQEYNYLTPKELASFWHFPGKEVPQVEKLPFKKMPVPEGIKTYPTIQAAWADGAIIFGRSTYRNEIQYIGFTDVIMLMQHMYMIAGTGGGKTTLLQFIALQLIITGKAGITFFDVKGDAVDKILRYLPPAMMNKINYIDLKNDEYYMPYNILNMPGVEIYDLAALIVQVFVTVFGESSIQAHSQNILRNALIAVLSADKNASILEVYRLFTDEAYLDFIVKEMRANTEYPDTLSYFEYFKDLKPKARRDESKAILNKLQMITQQTRPRLMLSQKENHLPWRKLMDDKMINLVNLDIGKNPSIVQRFFGTLFTTMIRQATFSRSDTPEDNRVPHIFMLDEFEKFTSKDEDFKELLALARSYRLGLMLVHQSIEQLDKSLLGQILDNTFTKVCLNIEVGSAGLVSQMFPGFKSSDLSGLAPFQAVGRFKKVNADAFSFETLKIEEYFADNGQAFVEKVKMACYKKTYTHYSVIKDEIQERYRLTRDNLIQDNSSPVKNTGKRKSSASGNAKGVKDIGKPTIVEISSRRPPTDA